MSGLAVPVDDKAVRLLRRKLGFAQVEGRIRQLEDKIIRMERQMRDYGIPIPVFDPFDLCRDDVDRKILEVLWDSSGLTTTEISEEVEVHRHTVLRRLKSIQKRALEHRELNPPDREEKVSLFAHEGYRWQLNREVLL